MRVVSLMMTVALMTATIVVASLASQDKSFRVPYSNAPPPHVGNGFVAAFLNNSNEYVAGVFSGSTVKSTRAALPATNTRYLASIPGGAPPQWWLHESTGTGRLALFDANSNYVGEQVWLAARAPLAMADAPSWNLLGSTISFVVVAPDAGNVSLSWIVPTPDMSDYPLVDLVYHNTSVDRPDVHIAVYQTTIPEEAAPISSTILIATVWRVPSATTVASQDWASSAIISSRCTEFVVAGFLDQQIQTVIECARHRYDAIDANVDTAILQHLTAWSEMWDGSMTTTNSNASSVLDRVITSSMYALYSSLHHLAPFSTSPGGLPTDGYNGHTFWDMETWMMPNLVLLEPELTKGSPIRYRLDRLEGASVNAVSVVNGTTGYAFPWESAFTGYDVCPWPQGEHSEIHITADVVNGWKLYYDATHDDDFLSSAFVALVNTSRFWLSRAVVDTTGVYHINDVTPPDEYHYGNDSAYTNSAVKIAVEFTLRAADILNKTIPEAPFLSALAAGLFVPYNATGNYHPEFTGYEGDKVKQADVVLMNYPLGVTMDPSTARNDLLYYAPRTDPRGPAMTWSVFSIGYMGLKDQVNADKYFREGYNLNTVPPYYQWYEVPGAVGCPNFLTGAGGFLQSVWAGIGGLRVRAETLRITEAHMLGVDGVQSLTLHRIYYRGVPLKLEYALKDNTTTYVGITRLPAEDGARKMPKSIRGFTGVELLHFDVPQHRRVGSPHVALYANGRALVEDHVVVFNLNTETQVDIGTTASPHQQ